MNKDWDVQVRDADVLVLGGGLAGHRAAVSARRAGATVVHAYHARGASPHVIGWNVPLAHADPRDSPDAYYADMLRGGYQLNDKRLVRVLADGALPAFVDLETMGVPFTRSGDHYAQRHLSGNTYARSVYHPDGIGRLMLDCLAKTTARIGVETYSGWKAIALLRDGGDVLGALLVKRNTGKLLAVHAGATVLATGGIGAIYADSTYPVDVVADSYALALDAGATLIDMEFVQFEPTVVVHPAGCRGMEMPTAMLGDGAPLLNARGERFMFRYNPAHGEKQIEKARMSLCIQSEIDAGRALPDGGVLFDTTRLDTERLESYVMHCRRLRAAGLDPAREAPHVRPAAHSQMGGVLIEADCATGVPGLYAAGEASGGVHGASRLAGNGGSEVIVFGGLAGAAAARRRVNLQGRDWARMHSSALQGLRRAQGRTGAGTPREMKTRLRETLRQAAGLYRSEESLENGATAVAEMRRIIDAGLTSADRAEAVRALEAENMARVGEMIIAAARERRESRGAHQRTDFRERDDARWLKHVALRKSSDGGYALDSEPIH